jgi:hypothetical protein
MAKVVFTHFIRSFCYSKEGEGGGGALQSCNCFLLQNVSVETSHQSHLDFSRRTTTREKNLKIEQNKQKEHEKTKVLS